ncbi:MAG: hypothetical protein ACLU3I_00365 [Acutalibacteraceae bacterium]
MNMLLKIKMGFYNIPIVVAFLAAILVACLQNRALSFDEKLEVMAKGVGDKNIMTMILIFLAGGRVRRRRRPQQRRVGRVFHARAHPGAVRRGGPVRGLVLCLDGPWAPPAAPSR